MERVNEGNFCRVFWYPDFTTVGSLMYVMLSDTRKTAGKKRS